MTRAVGAVQVRALCTTCVPSGPPVVLSCVSALAVAGMLLDLRMRRPAPPPPSINSVGDNLRTKQALLPPPLQMGKPRNR